MRLCYTTVIDAIKIHKLSNLYVTTMSKTDNVEPDFFKVKVDSYLFALSTATLVSFVFIYQTPNLLTFFKIILGGAFFFNMLSVAFFILSGIRQQIRHRYAEKIKSEFFEKAKRQIEPLIERIARPIGRIEGNIEVVQKMSNDDEVKRILSNVIESTSVIYKATHEIAAIISEKIGIESKESWIEAYKKPIKGEKYSKFNYTIEILAERFKYPTFFLYMVAYITGILLAFIWKS